MEINSNNKKGENHLKFVETQPQKIILIKVIDQNFYEGRITLKNITNNHVVYKFFNHNEITYSISPSVYYIRPYQKFTVNIKRFEKVSIDQLKSKECFLLIALESENEITDINDAINLIKKEDIYSPTIQQIQLEIEFDNGSNSTNYYNMIQERMTIAKEYNEQLNLNSIESVEEMQKYIAEVKDEIEVYNTKIEKLLWSLKEISSNNVIKKPNILFDKNLFEKEMTTHIVSPKKLPLFLVIFFCCCGLFIGKFINRLI